MMKIKNSLLEQNLSADSQLEIKENLIIDKCKNNILFYLWNYFGIFSEDYILKNFNFDNEYDNTLNKIQKVIKSSEIIIFKKIFHSVLELSILYQKKSFRLLLYFFPMNYTPIKGIIKLSYIGKYVIQLFLLNQLMAFIICYF